MKDLIKHHQERDPQAKVQEGEIFYSSWGWEQTNIDFYQVISVTPSGKSVKLRKIESDFEYNKEYMTGINMPKKDCFVEREKPFTKRLQYDSFSGVAVRLESYSSAWIWDGQPKKSSHYA